MTLINPEPCIVEKLIFDSVDSLEDDVLEKLKNLIEDIEHERREYRLIGKVFSHTYSTGTVYYMCTYVTKKGTLNGICFKPHQNGSVTIENYSGFPIEAKELEGPLPSNVIDALDIVHSLAGRYDNLRKMEPKDK